MTEVYEYLKAAQDDDTRVVDYTAIVQSLVINDIGGFTYTTDLYFPGANIVKHPQPLSFHVTEPNDQTLLITCGYRYADQPDFTYGDIAYDELVWLFKSGIVPVALRSDAAVPGLQSLLKN